MSSNTQNLFIYCQYLSPTATFNQLNPVASTTHKPKDNICLDLRVNLLFPKIHSMSPAHTHLSIVISNTSSFMLGDVYRVEDGKYAGEDTTLNIKTFKNRQRGIFSNGCMSTGLWKVVKLTYQRNRNRGLSIKNEL